MSRLLPLLFVAACGPGKPVVGPAVAERPLGAEILADADKRWEAFSTAQSEALAAALDQANAATPTVPGVNERSPISTGPVDMKREPSWLPDRERFRIVYRHTVVQMQNGHVTSSGGCGKYRNWPPDAEPRSQPSPAPCPPPVPMPVVRSWSATSGLVLEYTEAGVLVAEQPSPWAPNLPKPDAPKG